MESADRFQVEERQSQQGDVDRVGSGLRKQQPVALIGGCWPRIAQRQSRCCQIRL